MVTTWTKAYYTIDQGMTWHESHDFHGPVSGLLQNNDTIFSLRAKGLDSRGDLYATIAMYYTLDFGNSWKYVNWSTDLKKRIGIVQVPSNGAEYFLKMNLTPVSTGSTSAYINPTDLMKRSGTDTIKMLFPYTHYIYNLHLDSKERLYVAVSGGYYQESTNRFYCCTDYMPGIVYVSRNPRP